MAKRPRIHFLLIYPINTAPSQRFRFEQFFPFLKRESFEYTVDCFYDKQTFNKLYQKGGKFILALRLIFCFLRRCVHMFTIGRYDVVLIQRSAAPFGPPVFEWIIRFIWRKQIIYDFDDSIWRQPEGRSSFAIRLIKAHFKVPLICKWAHVVVVGNKYLAAYAKQFNKNVVIIPTVVDTESRFVPNGTDTAGLNSPMVIGWTGSHTTLPYLEALEPVFEELAKTNRFTLMVMANRPPNFKKQSFHFVPWSEEAEVAELRKIDIGIMPLPNDEWTKGKCGFKAIQYMALEKPAVASAVGINSEIIDNGVNGYLCANHEQWLAALAHLINNPSIVREQGKAAREKIIKYYSLRKAEQEWMSVLQAV